MSQAIMAIGIGALFSAGTYLLLSRDVVKVVLGTIVFSQGANLYLITMGGRYGSAPIIGHSGAHSTITDPVVQALVLTAIVIGLGTTSFILVLTYRLNEEHGTIDLEKLGDIK